MGKKKPSKSGSSERIPSNDFKWSDSDLLRMFGSIFRELQIDPDEIERGSPIIYGFNLKFGEDGKPMLERFGNVQESPAGARLTDEREPLVDVIDNGKEITVIAELPGVRKDDITVKVAGNILKISAKGYEQSRNYFKRVHLPSEVEKKSIVAKYTNGIIEIRMEKLKGGDDEREIKIE